MHSRYNGNNRDLVIQLEFLFPESDLQANTLLVPKEVVVTVPRDTNTFLVSLCLSNGPLRAEAGTLELETQPQLLIRNSSAIADLTRFYRTFQTLADTLYVGSFRNAINVGTRQDYFDIQVGEAFIKAWREYKSGPRIRENEAARRVEEDIGRIFNFSKLQINPSSDVQTMQLFINEKSFTLSELGSGLTQFILVLANAAIKQPSFILIDEPELNLHPSLQIDFLTSVASYARKGVVFASHNIGLVRSISERVYSLQKLSEFESKITLFDQTPRLSEFLGELSFLGYRELGFDRVLLVEGIKDVKTIQQFLRLIRKDHELVLLPLGGSALINGEPDTELQLQEIKRISEKISALIDSERANEEAPLASDRQAFVELCERAEIPCCVLNRRAIENYFTDRALKALKGPNYRALLHYQKLADASPGWSKTENWRIAREMKWQELESTDLGKFLSEL